VVLNFCSDTEPVHAKSILLAKFSCLSKSDFAIGKRGSSSRPHHDAELDDIIGAIEVVVDNKGLFTGVRFAAENLERLPNYVPEELNVCAVVDGQRAMKASVLSLAGRLDAFQSIVKSSPGDSNSDSSMCFSLFEFDKTVSGALTSLAARVENCNVTLGVFADKVEKIQGAPPKSHLVADRSMNVVVSDVAEDRDTVQWRQKVDDILQFVAGGAIEIVDMIRVGGRFREGRVRPVLIKLKSVWDRRLLLSSCCKLKDYPVRNFIHPDEPLDIRLRQTFDRFDRTQKGQLKAKVK
jgi:hypothetical protein